MPRHIEKMHKIHMLRPDILGASEFDVLTRVFPSPNGCKTRREGAGLRPKAEVYGGASWAPRHTAQGHRTIRSPEILPVSEEMGVGIEIGSGCLVGLRVFDLFVDGICIDHDADRARKVLLPEPRGPAKVDHGRCLSVK